MIQEILQGDPRLDVTVSEDPNILSLPEIHDYAMIFHHWMNWQLPPPKPEARENLEKFMAAGKGMVLSQGGNS